jgi:predicted nucleic acid-binding protein
MFEVLRGSRDMHRYARAHLALTKALVLDAPTPQQRYEEAAQLYMRCRAEGVTVSSRIDWLIAACAIAYDIPLVHHDNDFEHMARVVPLKTRRVVA